MDSAIGCAYPIARIVPITIRNNAWSFTHEWLDKLLKLGRRHGTDLTDTGHSRVTDPPRRFFSEDIDLPCYLICESELD
jgi:hypothetical protein